MAPSAKVLLRWESVLVSFGSCRAGRERDTCGKFYAESGLVEPELQGREPQVGVERKACRERKAHGQLEKKRMWVKRRESRVGNDPRSCARRRKVRGRWRFYLCAPR
jgi:hypothetical protein